MSADHRSLRYARSGWSSLYAGAPGVARFESAGTHPRGPRTGWNAVGLLVSPVRADCDLGDVETETFAGD